MEIIILITFLEGSDKGRSVGKIFEVTNQNRGEDFLSPCISKGKIFLLEEIAPCPLPRYSPVTDSELKNLNRNYRNQF